MTRNSAHLFKALSIDSVKLQSQKENSAKSKVPKSMEAFIILNGIDLGTQSVPV